MVRPGPPGPEMPNIEGLGAPCVVDWEKLRDVGEEELGSLWVVRLRAAEDASTRAECAGAAVVWAARPLRMAGTRALCADSIDIVTGASSAAKLVLWWSGRCDAGVGCCCAGC